MQIFRFAQLFFSRRLRRGIRSAYPFFLSRRLRGFSQRIRSDYISSLRRTLISIQPLARICKPCPQTTLRIGLLFLPRRMQIFRFAQLFFSRRLRRGIRSAYPFFFSRRLHGFTQRIRSDYISSLRRTLISIQPLARICKPCPKKTLRIGLLFLSRRMQIFRFAQPFFSRGFSQRDSLCLSFLFFPQITRIFAEDSQRLYFFST